MIWNDDVLYIHVPKTGGMSATNLLEQGLEGPVYSSVPAGHEGHGANVTYVRGLRHERVHEANALLQQHGRTLDSFQVIVAGMRNPYDLEVSRFNHICMHFLDQNLRNVELIKTEGFEGFFEKSNFYGWNPPKIYQFYTDRHTPLPNLRLIRYENLREDLLSSVESYLTDQAPELPHLNASVRVGWQKMMTERAEAAIYERFKWAFEQGHYPRYRPEKWPTTAQVEAELAQTRAAVRSGSRSGT